MGRGRTIGHLFESAEQVANWLAQTGIEVLVIDKQASADSFEQQQLQQVLASHKDQWQRIGVYDLVRNGQVVRDCITVYRQTGLDSYVEKSLEINMSEMLGRNIRQE